MVKLLRACRRPREHQAWAAVVLPRRRVVGGGTLVLAALLGAMVVAAALWATSGDNVDTAFSGFLWALLLFGVVTGMIWGLGAWVVGG